MTDSTNAEPAVALPSGIGKLSPTVAMALGNMTPQERDIFDHEYGKRRQGVAAVVVLGVLFPIHFFLIGKSGLGVAYWLTGGFLVVGWVVCWFLAPSMTREYNEQTANEIIRNIRYASGQ